MAVKMSDSAPFWRGFEEGVVRIPVCTECNQPHLPPGPVCPYCLSAQLQWQEASGRASLNSWVVERNKYFEAFDPPYIVAEVQLAEGPRMPAQLARIYIGKLKCGMSGRIEISTAPNGLALPEFIPDDGHDG